MARATWGLATQYYNWWIGPIGRAGWKADSDTPSTALADSDGGVTTPSLRYDKLPRRDVLDTPRAVARSVK
jgi:hypothetical protein